MSEKLTDADLSDMAHATGFPREIPGGLVYFHAMWGVYVTKDGPKVLADLSKAELCAIIEEMGEQLRHMREQHRRELRIMAGDGP